MGKEAVCRAIAGANRGDVRVHLDAERLRVSGAVRLNVPLAQLRGLAVSDGALCFEFGGQRVVLELGAKAATAWEREITQPKSLLEKLGVHAGQRVCLLGLGGSFGDDVAHLASRAALTSLRGAFDIIFCAVDDEKELERIARCKAHLVPNGALWIVSPKGKGSPVRESAVRAAILAAGLVDTKVVSFSATQTAAKAVIPVAAR